MEGAVAHPGEPPEDTPSASAGGARTRAKPHRRRQRGAGDDRDRPEWRVEDGEAHQAGDEEETGIDYPRRPRTVVRDPHHAAVRHMPSTTRATTSTQQNRNARPRGARNIASGGALTIPPRCCDRGI